MHHVCESGIASLQASSRYVLLLRHPIDSSQQVEGYQDRLFAIINTGPLPPRFNIGASTVHMEASPRVPSDLLQPASCGPRAALSLLSVALTRGRHFYVRAGWQGSMQQVSTAAG